MYQTRKEAGLRYYIGTATLVIVVAMLVLFSKATLADMVNLNTAEAEALQYIPGIGPGKAEEIIKARKASGGFKSYDELLEIPGIGAKTLEDIRQYGSLDTGVSELTDEMMANPPGKKKSASETGD